MSIVYYILRAILLCVGIALVLMAAIDWMNLEGFREPSELARPLAVKALLSFLTLLYGVLLLTPHRWTVRGTGYALKLAALVLFGCWALWVSAVATLGYLSGQKHWMVTLFILIATFAAIGGPLTLVWRSRIARSGSP